LAARGIEVHGIDAFEAMVAKLRAKPGGEDSGARRRLLTSSGESTSCWTGWGREPEQSIPKPCHWTRAHGEPTL
jgi:hypothetical protein